MGKASGNTEFRDITHKIISEDDTYYEIEFSWFLHKGKHNSYKDKFYDFDPSIFKKEIVYKIMDFENETYFDLWENGNRWKNNKATFKVDRFTNVVRFFVVVIAGGIVHEVDQKYYLNYEK